MDTDSDYNVNTSKHEKNAKTLPPPPSEIQYFHIRKLGSLYDCMRVLRNILTRPAVIVLMTCMTKEDFKLQIVSCIRLRSIYVRIRTLWTSARKARYLRSIMIRTS
ncbi:hypothetical protein ABKN59_000208 [Abortiporus biennis]